MSARGENRSLLCRELSPKHLGTAPAIHLFDISHFRAPNCIAVEQLQRQASLGPRRFLNSREITCNSRRTFSTPDPVNSASRSHG